MAFGPPAIPGLGTGAGFTMELQDRVGNTPEYLADQAHAVHGGGAEAAGDRPHRLALSRERAAGLRRHRPQQGAEGGRADRRRQHDARLAAGQRLRERLQPVRPRLQGLRAGRARVPDRPEAVRPVLRAQRERRHGAARHARDHAADERAGVHQPVQPVPGGGTDRRAGGGLQLGAGAEGARGGGGRPNVLSPDMGYDWADMSYQEKRAPSPGPTFAVAIFLVFLVLAAQYESWSLPFSVLLGTPFAAFGAYFGLWIARHSSPSYVNNIFAQIGLIMLIGLAAKNAILIVEFAKMLHEQGKDVATAALESARLRFRPILMTAFAFILGVVAARSARAARAPRRGRSWA